MSKNYYITTTLPYVNASPHIGFALEIIQADVLARYNRLNGNKVFFNFGTDEHGQKIYQKALEKKKDPQEYVDEYAKKFDNLKSALNLSYDAFIRTTDKNHIEAAQEMWKICSKNGFIEKGQYNAKYCVGCELEKQDSDLEKGVCQWHPNKKIQIIKEENYFFKFSKFEKQLLRLYKDNPDFIVPKHRSTEIQNFVSAGLKDFSISRLKEKMPWGIEVPRDPKHVMYVWFDALTNYISTLGWPNDLGNFEKFWGTKKSPKAIQIAGKDNLRQQTAMWQAMLMAADLPVSKQILIHGFITSDGAKMSKSLGNVIDPIKYSQKYGEDALRYYLLAKVSPTEDSDFTKEKFEEVYNSDLSNGLGNLVSRVAKMAEVNNINCGKSDIYEVDKFISEPIEKFRFDWALDEIWKKIKVLDTKINNEEMWKGTDKKIVSFVEVVEGLRQISFDLKSFLPETADKIEKIFKGPKIKSTEPLFPRL
ncbi:methionine--tRNA ligase [Candidatus Microgenomates bacterium]|nr:methionine--tRNA ligase [Candidatus Microgenomates bacterium]